MDLPLPDRVLRRLSEARGEAVSGQHLGSDLGVSRAAIWKAVGTLRGEGYRIESVTARGYRLLEGGDGLRPGQVAAALGNRTLGRPLRYLAAVDSTNREAQRWAEAGAPEGALVLAEHQHAGRGRLERRWLDTPHHSLLLSLVLRPALPVAAAPPLTFVAAAALADTLQGWVAPDRIEIKWPNDVLVDGAKVAGILLELRSEGNTVQFVILGVGVNVAGAAPALPAGTPQAAASVAQHATRPVQRLDVLCGFLETFENLYEQFLADGFGAARERWNAWFRSAGRPLRVRTPTGLVEGVARGLAPDGALELTAATGGTVPVYAGDVEQATTRDT